MVSEKDLRMKIVSAFSVFLLFLLPFCLFCCYREKFEDMETEWDANKYYEMGVFYFTHREYRRAKAEFLMSVQKDPHFAKGYIGAAFASFMLGNANCMEKAFDKCATEHNLSALLFLKALKENNKLEEAYYGLGQLFFFRWQLEKKIEHTISAREFLEKANALNPERALTHYYLGVIYAVNDNFRKAEKELKEYLRLKPNAENKQIVLEIMALMKNNKQVRFSKSTEKKLINDKQVEME